MRIKTVAARVGTALCNAADEMHNSTVRTQITKIDEQQNVLREQLVRLEQDRTNLDAKIIRR